MKTFTAIRIPIYGGGQDREELTNDTMDWWDLATSRNTDYPEYQSHKQFGCFHIYEYEDERK